MQRIRDNTKMRFPPSFLDDVKARLPVSDVVRRRVKLVKAGREWKGLSPFNAEKTPSFFVNDQKMAWFDLSAGKNGNIFDFVMETEGLTFPEAVERLAGEAGLPLPRSTPEAEAQEERRAGLHEALDMAADFFSATLNGVSGRPAREYLAQRGIAPDSQKQFRLGFAPAEKYALRDHLAAKGVAKETMIEAGLLIHGEDIAVPYDRFRDRIMFPIADRSGRPIAFGGRALTKEVAAKYLNSPETPLFHKGAMLYNHHLARKAAHASGRIIVVEGYVDVIAMASAGFPETVAPLGTALTPDQAALLWKMAEEPILCFDGDRAGRKAAYRAIDMAMPLIGPQRSLRFALLPEGQDPDDLIRNGGAPAMAALLSKAVPAADLIWKRETEGQDFSNPDRQADLEHRLDAIAGEIKDQPLRRRYRAHFRDCRIKLFYKQRDRRPWKVNGRPAQEFVPPVASENLLKSPLFQAGTSSLLPREALILLLLLNHPGLLERHLEEIAEIEFSNAEAGALRDILLDRASSAPLDGEEIRRAAKEAGFASIVQRLYALAAHSTHFYLKDSSAEVDAEEVLRQALTLHRRARTLHKDMNLAEAALAQDPSEASLARLKDIQEQLLALGGTEATIEGFGASSGRAGGTL
jgi:DNA primase